MSNFWMWQSQVKENEREERRKSFSYCREALGHTVKSCVTVISYLMGRYPIHT